MRRQMKYAAAALAAGLSALITAFPAAAGTWNHDGTSWRYEDDAGRSVEAGWIKDRNAWYFFAKDGSGKGAMQVGWINEDGKWYYLDPQTGAMVTNTVIDGYYLDESGVWEDGGSSGSRTTSRRSSRSSDDEDEDYDETESEEWLDEDQEDWDDSGADSGPGYDMQDLTRDNGKGPGGKASSSSDTVYTTSGNVVERTTYTQSSLTPSSYNQKHLGDVGKSYDDDEDEEDEDYDEEEGYDDDESGGTKADWIAANGNGYRKEDEKPASQYSHNGSNFDYSQTTVKDESGDTRTIIKKTRVRGDKADSDSDDDED